MCTWKACDDFWKRAGKVHNRVQAGTSAGSSIFELRRRDPKIGRSMERLSYWSERQGHEESGGHAQIFRSGAQAISDNGSFAKPAVDGIMDHASGVHSCARTGAGPYDDQRYRVPRGWNSSIGDGVDLVAIISDGRGPGRDGRQPEYCDPSWWSVSCTACSKRRCQPSGDLLRRSLSA